MTMNFRLIRDALVTLLGNEAAGQYVTLGYQKQANSAEELLDTSRNVQVYYANGEFPKSKASLNGPTQHDMTFNIDCMVSKRAEVDLSVLENPASTSTQRATALAATRIASDLANDSLDELYDIIYQIVMSAANLDLGLSFNIANRWLGRMEKDSPIPAGEYCVLTGVMQLTCSMDEQVSGLEPVVGTGGITMDLEINEEYMPQAGVTNEFTYLIDDDSGDFLIDDESGDYVVEG